MAIAVGHHFIGFFGGRIEANRVVCAIFGGERNFCIRAINARRACVDQMLDSMLAATLKDIGESNQIGLNVSGGISEAVTNTSLRSEVDDSLRLKVIEYTGQLFSVR